MQANVHAAATQGYTRAAGVYDRARPSYPGAAVEWILSRLGTPDRVVEIGAGTGKLTAQLVERCVEVIAVEPVAAMRDRLPSLGPLVQLVDATAEQLPLGTASERALVAGQSLHWTDVPKALEEFDRVLDPRGAVGLLWNFRDRAVTWQRDLDALLSELRGDAPHSRDRRWQRAVEHSPFVTAARETWHWTLTTDEEGVLDRVRSVSYVAALTAEQRQEVDASVIDLLRRHGLSEPIQFPYVTEAYVLQRRGGADL